MGDRETNGREPATGDSAGPDDHAPKPVTTPEPQRRLLSDSHAHTGGYSRAEVDELLDQAAETVQRLRGQAALTRDGLAKPESSEGAAGDRLEIAGRRSPEEVVGEVLISAHRAAESVIEEARRVAASIETRARRDAAPILTEAQRALAEARWLRREARGTLEEATQQADAILQQARAERKRLIESSTADAERRRAELEAANMRLETAIKGLRSEWAGRAAEALARLEGVALDPGLPAEGSTQLGSLDAELDSAEDERAAPRSASEVADELHARLRTAEAGEAVQLDRSSPRLP